MTEVLIIEDSVGARLVSECVELAIGAFVFEPPNGGMVVVTYPFVFRTE